MTFPLSVTTLTAGEAVAVTRAVRAALDAHAEAGGEDALDPVLHRAAAALERACDDVTARAKPKSRLRVDHAADRCIAGLHAVLQGHVRAFTDPVVPLTPEERDRRERAERLLHRLFPNGTGFLIGRRSNQYGLTEALLEQTERPETRDEIAAFGLGPHLALLRRTHVLYGERMGYTAQPDGPATALDDWHEALRRYLAAVIATVPTGDPRHDELLAPYTRAAEEARAARRRRRGRSEDGED